MKPWTVWVFVVIAVAAGAGGGYWLGHRATGAAKDGGGKEAEPAAGAAGEEKAEPPVVSVRVAPVRRGTIAETITAYGTVVAPASEVRVVSVPFESRVTKMRVTPGQTVAAGEPLIEVEGTAATVLALEEARRAAAAADQDLQLVRQRYEQKLATNTELYAAENAQRTAQGRLQSLQQGGAAGPRQLNAEVAGVVSKVDVQIGQVVTAGGPLVEVAAQNQIEVKLGAESQDVPYLKPGHEVQLRRVDDPAAAGVIGKVRLIGRRVDPATRLVDVLVSLPPDANLLLEVFVAGRMTRSSVQGLIVPRDAVLPAEAGDEGEGAKGNGGSGGGGGFTLFTVKDGHAVKHDVKVGIENDREVQVVADDLKEGDLAVVVGNYELEDKTQVRVQSATTEAATTEPVEAPEAERPEAGGPESGGPQVERKGNPREKMPPATMPVAPDTLPTTQPATEPIQPPLTTPATAPAGTPTRSDGSSTRRASCFSSPGTRRASYFPSPGTPGEGRVRVFSSSFQLPLDRRKALSPPPSPGVPGEGVVSRRGLRAFERCVAPMSTLGGAA